MQLATEIMFLLLYVLGAWQLAGLTSSAPGWWRRFRGSEALAESDWTTAQRITVGLIGQLAHEYPEAGDVRVQAQPLEEGKLGVLNIRSETSISVDLALAQLCDDPDETVAREAQRLLCLTLRHEYAHLRHWGLTMEGFEASHDAVFDAFATETGGFPGPLAPDDALSQAGWDQLFTLRDQLG